MEDDPRETVRRLADLDYREAEPAGRFRPRPEAPR